MSVGRREFDARWEATFAREHRELPPPTQENMAEAQRVLNRAKADRLVGVFHRYANELEIPT